MIHQSQSSKTDVGDGTAFSNKGCKQVTGLPRGSSLSHILSAPVTLLTQVPVHIPSVAFLDPLIAWQIIVLDFLHLCTSSSSELKIKTSGCVLSYIP